MTRNEWIEKLNSDARAIWNGEEGHAALRAVEKAADANDLEEVREDEQCRIYRTPDGTLVNCWIEGVQSERIEDGGMGFDDQVDWYEEETDAA
jgi:hypothetical protein